MAKYVRLSDGLTKYELIPANQDVWDYISTNERDFYTSLYQYNDEHYKKWKETNTVSGIRDTTTNKLFFDFDDESQPENARQDAITLCTRLLSLGVPEDLIQVSFSGNKGFSIEIDTTSTFMHSEFKNITFGLAADLTTFDPVVNDPNRLIRVVGTRHMKSGLYKKPLTVKQLSEFDIPTIKNLAGSIHKDDLKIVKKWQKEVVLPETIINLKEAKKVEKSESTVEVHDLDLSKKPKWLSEAKFALQEGYFGSGERNTAFMILASTYKNQGFNDEITYRMLKGVAEVQAKRNNVERYSDVELWRNIVQDVFKPTWKGGQYSYDNTPLLQEVTKRLGLKIPSQDVKTIVNIEEVTNIFRKFATEIDDNTIKLGIPLIDEKIRVTTSMLVGLLAAPSAGKTSVSLSVLNSISNSNLKAMFFSLDMATPLVVQRLIQKHTGYSSNKIFDMYQANDPSLGDIEKKVADEYKNVKFCFRSGVTTEDIKQHILAEQERSGEKVRLVVVDYLECLQGPYSDSTANTALIAQQLKDIANDLEICILLLLQPQKHAGDPSAELLSMRQVKGSSVIEQAASIIFTMFRPGFSAKNPEQDKYLTIAVVKNRMGSLASFDFNWNGLTGEITTLDDFEKEDLNALREKKQQEKITAELEL